MTSGKLFYLPIAVVTSKLAMKSVSQSSEGPWSIHGGVNGGVNDALKTSPLLLLPLMPLPLLCRTCESGARGGQSFSHARPPSSKGLWPRSSCLWMGTGPCVDPTGNQQRLLLPTPWRCWSKDRCGPTWSKSWSLAQHGPRTLSQTCSPPPKLGGEFARPV